MPTATAPPRPRVSIAVVMMLTVTAASASALYSRVTPHLDSGRGPVAHPEDLAALVVAAVASTGVGLAAWRKHSPSQAMLQITLACLALLSLNGLAELSAARNTVRPLLYWFQAAFALLVVAPLVARRVVRARTERGPTRNRRARDCEAVAFAFLNVMLVFAGLVLQLVAAEVLDHALRY